MSNRLRQLIAAIGIIVVPIAITAGAQNIYSFGGVDYVFPSSQGAASTVLVNDGSGTLSWTVAEQVDVVVPMTGGACPSGWSEYTEARGRYIVGMPSGGTLGGTVGTALTDQENRSVGQHTHTLTDPGHTHVQNAHGHSVVNPGHSHVVVNYTASVFLGDGGPSGTFRISTPPSTSATATAVINVTVGTATATNSAALTGITVGNSGTVLGTNAPYVQRILCRSTEGS